MSAIFRNNATPRVKPRKTLRRANALLFALVLFTSVISSVVLPELAKAAHGGDQHHPLTQAQAYAALNWWLKCDSNEGLTDDNRSEEQMNTARVFNQPFGSQDPKQLGYVFDIGDVNDDGLMTCADGHGGPMLTALDINPLTFLTRDTGMYRFDEDEGAYVRTGTSTRQDIRDAFSQYFPDVNFGQNMTREMLYFAYLETFRANCIEESDTTGGTEVQIVDMTGNVTNERHIVSSSNDNYLVGYGVPNPAETINDADYLRCSQLVSRINEHAAAVAETIRGLDLDEDAIPGGGGAGGDDEENEEDACEARGRAMGWILCPLVTMVDLALDFIDRQIQGMLTVDVSTFDREDFRNAFNRIRNIGYTLVLLAVVIVTGATAFGLDVLAAYSFRRAFPQIILAVVLMTFLYDLCVAGIEFVDLLGRSMLGILTGAFNVPGDMSLGYLFAPNTGGGALISIVTSIQQTAIYTAGLLFLLWVYGSLFLLIAALVFVALMARQLFIIALVLVSPLAVVARILPGTQKLWRAWWTMFTKLLLMFPVIMIILALGRIFAWIIREGGGGAGLQLFFVRQISMFTVYLLPYGFILLIILLILKAAGFGWMTDFLGGIQQGMGKTMGQKRGEKLKNIGLNQAIKGRNVVSRGVGRGLQIASQLPRAGITGIFRPRAGVARVKGALEEREVEAVARAKELESVKNVINNDGLLNAGESRNEADIRRYLSEHPAGPGLEGAELEEAVAAVMKAQHDAGGAWESIYAEAVPATGSGRFGENWEQVPDPAAPGGMRWVRGREDGLGRSARDVSRAARGSYLARGRLVAAVKAAYKRGSRNLSGTTPFGQLLGASRRVERGDDLADIHEDLVDAGLHQAGAGAIIGSRSEDVVNAAGGARRRTDRRLNAVVRADNALQAAIASGNPARIARARRLFEGRTRQYEQGVAENEALKDYASAAAPVAAERLANDLQAAEIDLNALPAATRAWILGGAAPLPIPPGTTVSHAQLGERMSNRPAVEEMRRTIPRYAAGG